MHTVSDWSIPVCVAGSVESPYAYGDLSPINHNTRTGILKLLVRIRGLPLCARAPFPRCALVRTPFRSWLRRICQNLLPYAFGEPLYAYGQGLLRIRIRGVPVRIMKSCAYGDQHILLSIRSTYNKFTQAWMEVVNVVGVGNYIPRGCWIWGYNQILRKPLWKGPINKKNIHMIAFSQYDRWTTFVMTDRVFSYKF